MKIKKCAKCGHAKSRHWKGISHSTGKPYWRFCYYPDYPYGKSSGGGMCGCTEYIKEKKEGEGR